MTRFFLSRTKTKILLSKRKNIISFTFNVIGTILFSMITTFLCKESEKIFNRTFSKKLPHDIQRGAYKKLIMLDAAKNIEDLKIPPANRLEKLIGDREGSYSIRINQQYRICFQWNNGNAENVEIIDYH